jgi:GNAT superfamily N-acetyltransferase
VTTVSSDALFDALEMGSLVVPAVEGQAWFLDVPGVTVRESVIPSPFANLAGGARLAGAIADPAIRRVRAHFEDRGKPFGWMVSPRSTPHDLPARLTRAGVPAMQGCRGLVLTDLAHPVPTSPRISVREAGPADRAVVDALKAASFDMPLGVARAINSLLFDRPSPAIKLHLAFDGEKPVAFAQTFYAARTGVAILGGGGTLPEARGAGAYRTLLARRLADARRDGMAAAAIQAYEDTSAPILLRLGFRELGRLVLHAWAPRPA